MLDWIVLCLRTIQFAGAMVLFGAPLFYLYANQRPQRWHDLLAAAVLITLVAASLLAAWVQSGLLLGNWPNTGVADAGWYLTDTRIGHVMLGRIAAAAVYALLFRLLADGRRNLGQMAVGGAILASFAWTGHGAERGGFYATADVVHLLMAGIWVGALVPLCLSIRSARKLETSADEISRGLDAFSRIGIAVVALLVTSGIGNALLAFGVSNWGMILRSGYGITLLAKVAILSGMLALAAANRYRFAPKLAAALRQQDDPVAALGALQRSLAVETALAIAVLGLAAHLGSMEPPGH